MTNIAKKKTTKTRLIRKIRGQSYVLEFGI